MRLTRSSKGPSPMEAGIRMSRQSMDTVPETAAHVQSDQPLFLTTQDERFSRTPDASKYKSLLKSEDIIPETPSMKQSRLSREYLDVSFAADDRPLFLSEQDERLARKTKFDDLVGEMKDFRIFDDHGNRVTRDSQDRLPGAGTLWSHFRLERRRTAEQEALSQILPVWGDREDAAVAEYLRKNPEIAEMVGLSPDDEAGITGRLLCRTQILDPEKALDIMAVIRKAAEPEIDEDGPSPMG